MNEKGGILFRETCQFLQSLREPQRNLTPPGAPRPPAGPAPPSGVGSRVGVSPPRGAPGAPGPSVRLCCAALSKAAFEVPRSFVPAPVSARWSWGLDPAGEKEHSQENRQNSESVAY